MAKLNISQAVAGGKSPASTAATPIWADNHRGSLWRKWDLHIHTPASFHWNGGPRFSDMDAAQKEATLRRMIEKINSSDVAVFGVMDYWTFDGYLELRRFAEENSGILLKCVLPGIELRLEAPTDFRLNTHVLLSNDVSAETLTTFLHSLRCGGTINKPPTRETLIEIGRKYADDKLAVLGFAPGDRTDDSKMWLAGAKSVVITRESLQEAIHQVGENRCLILQPYDTSDGMEDLDWKAHPYDDQELMHLAHIFEAKHPIHINLFLGLGHPTKPEVQEAFLHNMGGCPKPAFRGSDAHRVEDYGNFPNNRIAWLKADPTFLGLRQVCYEPAARCWVGLRPPKLEHVDKNPTKYIRNVSVSRAKDADSKDRWFDAVSLDLNPGLIAIIGNKGSGKSALADLIALLGNTRTSEFEFLNPRRFRKGKTRAQFFTGAITWEDKTVVNRTLDLDPDPKAPERVRYLPQSAIEDLCNELAGEGPSDFEGELKKVIFSHVPLEQQMGRASLDHLINFKTGPLKEAVKQLQGTLASLNSRIVELENEISPRNVESYKNALALKKAELDAHLLTEPKAPAVDASPQPAVNQQVIEELTEAKTQHEALVAERDSLKTERVGLFTKQGNLENLTGKLKNLSAHVQKFREEIASELNALDLKIDEVLTFEVQLAPIKALQEKVKSRILEITTTLDGNEKITGLEQKIASSDVKLKGLQARLDAPQKALQEFLAKKAEWEKRRDEINGAPDRPDTKAFLEAKIKAATEVLPGELEQAKETRRKAVRDIHAQLILQRAEYEQLYTPVQRIATESPLTEKALKLDFAVFLSPTTLEEQFLNSINRQRRGPFQGEDEGARHLHELITHCDFSDAEKVVALLDSIIESMRAESSKDEGEKYALVSQLRKDVKVSEFYDALYSLRYLEPRYTLRLDGKEISELSPGEKGALLLVFYLLLDQDEVPIIIDQPEQNLDNESVVRLLVDCIRRARDRRQVILVTHSPNLAVVCDADQLISCKIDKASGNLISYESGAIENPKTNARGVDVLEGTFPAFDNRRLKWMKPVKLSH